MKTVKHKVIKENIRLDQCGAGDEIYVRGLTSKYSGSFLTIVKIKTLPKGKVQIKFRGRAFRKDEIPVVQKATVDGSTFVERTRKAGSGDVATIPSTDTVMFGGTTQVGMKVVEVGTNDVSISSNPGDGRKYAEALSLDPLAIFAATGMMLSQEDIERALSGVRAFTPVHPSMLEDMLKSSGSSTRGTDVIVIDSITETLGNPNNAEEDN